MPSSRWRRLLRPIAGNARRELDDELGFHLDTLVQDLIASGVSPEVARAEAERRFGTVSDIRDACLTIDRRRARRLAFKEYVHMISQDIRHVARAMRNAPGFAAVVTLTLALGVGATTAMYSVLDAVVLHPLAYAQSDRMVMVYDVERDATDAFPASYPEFLDWRGRSGAALSEVAGVIGHGEILSGRGDAVQLIGAQSSWNLPAMLGLRPIIGRLFRADEEGPGRNGVVILSEALWKQSFSGDSAVVGRPITLTGKPFVVIGVVADGARDVIPDPWHIASGKEAEFWIPLDFSVKTAPRDLRFMTVVGRLAPGITLAQASQRIGIMAAGLRREGVTTDSVRIAPLTSAVVGDLRQPLELMLAAVGVLLAIACANIANLLLAHTASRRRELAVRAALGAGRQRLLGLLFVESLARALIGGACGVGLAYLALAAAHRWLATALPRMAEVTLSANALGFALACSVVAGVSFGTVPALRASSLDLLGSLRDGGRGLTGTRDNARRSLIIVEMALSFVLLAGAGLLIRSFVQLMHVPMGFDTHGLVATDRWLPSLRYPDSTSQIAFWARYREALKARGAAHVTFASSLPIAGGVNGGVSIEGQTFGANDKPTAEKRIVAWDYFGVLHARIARGRDFTQGDRAGSAPVVIVNEAFARRYLPGQDPIGKRVQFAWGITGFQTIVGVVADVREGALDAAPPPAIYISDAQRPMDNAYVIVRSVQPLAATKTMMRDALRSVDATLPMLEVDSFDDVMLAT
ncbi:MAG TPA: ABC transporter permease, partial [Gemmatimonadaceae bacterium]|nr:ABC transporter permease [Gemmatimonadaceae bacterium]